MLSTGLQFICPICKSINHASERVGFIFKITRITCLSCKSVFDLKGKDQLLIKSLGPNYSGLTPWLIDRIVTVGVEPNFPVYSNSEMEEWMEGRIPKSKLDEAAKIFPAFLKKDEFPIVVIPNVEYFERKTFTVHRTQSQAVRVSKGVYLRTAETVAPEERVTQVKVDSGTVAFTNKRYIFIGSVKTIDQKIEHITTIMHFTDGIGVARDNVQKIEVYSAKTVWMPFIALIHGAMAISKKE